MLNLDCLFSILQYVNDGASYKSIIFTCSAFLDHYAPVHIQYVRKYSNHLLTLLKMYPDEKWEWSDVSKNPNITLDIILSYPEYPWDMYSFSQNENVTWDTVCEHPDRDWRGISLNPNITWTIVESNEHYDWNLEELWTNDNFMCTFWDYIYNNYRLEPLSVKTNRSTKSERIGEIIRRLSAVSSIMDDAEDYLHDATDPPLILKQSLPCEADWNEKWNALRNNPSLEWDWHRLSGEFDLTWDIVRSFPGAWDFTILSSNPFTRSKRKN